MSLDGESSFGPRNEVSRAGFDERLAELIAGSPHGLVSAADREVLSTRHIPECRALGGWLGAPEGRWMDLGTGGGLPGLVLARDHPQAKWVLVEARRKKAREVERFADELGVDCEVVAERCEELAWEPEHREGFEGVVGRAVAPLRVLVELARGFLGPGGRLVAVKGQGAAEEVRAAAGALESTRMRVERVEPLGVGETRVVEVRASGAAPANVPRRAGIPARRPR